MATSQERDRHWNRYVQAGGILLQTGGAESRKHWACSLTSPDFESVEATNEIFAVVMF